MEFEWDEEKACSNLVKHGVSFPYATRAFNHPMRLERLEDAYGYEEVRWSVTALIDGDEVMLVFTERGELSGIIPARKATRDERRGYWQDR